MYIFLIIAKIIEGSRNHLSSWFWNKWAYAYLVNHKAQIPHSSKIMFYGHTLLRIEPKAKVIIGENFICRSDPQNAIDNCCCTKIYVGSGATLYIGFNSGISNCVINCQTEIRIGNYVNIGAGTALIDSNFHSTNWKDREDRSLDSMNSKKSSIVIEDYAFIGMRCSILKGVHVGSKAIVAAGSVVVCDIPENEIWGGNPAKFIKKLNK